MSIQNIIDVSNICFGINSLKNKQEGSINNISVGLNACGGSSTGASGIENISIGKNSMNILLSGSYNIGIGSNALGSTTTLSNNIGIGTNAGYSNVGGNSIAIGNQAGQTEQRGNSIAIGYQAGNTNQGQSSIAIGYQAGLTNQANNSIIINATGTNQENTNALSCVINPIRNIVIASTSKMLLYNTSTNELQTDISNSLRFSTRGNVGLGIVPSYTLDVSGTINTNTGYNLNYSALPPIRTTQIGYTLKATNSAASGTIATNNFYNISSFSPAVPIGVWLCCGTSATGSTSGYVYTVGVSTTNGSTGVNLYIMGTSISASTWGANYGGATLTRIA